MIRPLLVALCLAWSCVSRAAPSEEKTKGDAPKIAALVGKHRLTLQWLTDGKAGGEAVIVDAGGLLRVSGSQAGKTANDKLTIDGVITEVVKDGFSFRGKIMTQVAFNNDGKPCEKTGDFTFKTRGGRKFWRLQEMRNNCQPPGENLVDYVDVFIAATK